MAGTALRDNFCMGLYGSLGRILSVGFDRSVEPNKGKRLGENRMMKKTILLLCGLIGLLSSAPSAIAARPTAPQLFPADTLTYIRVDDSRDFKEKMSQMSTARMFADPGLKPIVDDLYGSAIQLTARMQDAIGVNLEELLAIPNGEMAFAVYSNERKPVIVAMLEAGDELPALELILARAEEQLAQRSDRTEEKVGDLTLVIWKDRQRADREIAYFIDQGVFVAISQVSAAKKLCDVWQGKVGEGSEKYKTLAENRKFLTVMSQCVGSEGERPQISFYWDPLATVRAIITNSGNTAGTAVLALLSPLGIDGIQSIGASMIMSTKDFDSIIHAHLQLASPRKGVLEVVRPKSGSTVPEPWVPDDVGSYSTLNWEVQNTVNGIEKIFDTFQGEGAFKTSVLDRAKERTEIDFRSEIIEQITGRVTVIQGFVKPFRVNSGTNLFAVQLKDPTKFKDEVMPKFMKLMERGNAVPTRKSGGNGEFYVMERTGESPQRENAPSPDVVRRPRVCFGIMDDYFFVSDDTYMIDEISAAKDGRRGLLSASEEYELISAKVKEQLKDKETSILLFSKPQESLRVFYEMAKDPANKERLRGAAANNPVLQALSAALEKHELPPFDVIEKYLSPTGAFVTEDETGLHYTAFSMKKE